MLADLIIEYHHKPQTMASAIAKYSLLVYDGIPEIEAYEQTRQEITESYSGIYTDYNP
jgi:hypothetical protein